MSDLIYERLAAIMADVPAIPKGQTNRQQGYAFRGIDDMYDALHGLFVKHRVVILPHVLEAEYVDRELGTKLAIDARLHVEYLFVATDGSQASITVQGESRDYADKATNQAMSAALKYGLLQMFLIPLADSQDADAESPTVKVTKPKRPRVRSKAQVVNAAKNELVALMGKDAAEYWKLHQSMTPAEIVAQAKSESEAPFDQLPIEEKP